jgi:hypothetical protein
MLMVFSLRHDLYAILIGDLLRGFWISLQWKNADPPACSGGETYRGLH